MLRHGRLEPVCHAIAGVCGQPQEFRVRGKVRQHLEEAHGAGQDARLQLGGEDAACDVEPVPRLVRGPGGRVDLVRRLPQVDGGAYRAVLGGSADRDHDAARFGRPSDHQVHGPGQV